MSIPSFYIWKLKTICTIFFLILVRDPGKHSHGYLATTLTIISGSSTSLIISITDTNSISHLSLFFISTTTDLVQLLMTLHNYSGSWLLALSCSRWNYCHSSFWSLTSTKFVHLLQSLWYGHSENSKTQPLALYPDYLSRYPTTNPYSNPSPFLENHFLNCYKM